MVGHLPAPKPLVMVEDQWASISVRGARRSARVTRAVLEGTVAGAPCSDGGIASAPGGHVVTVNAIVANRDDAAFGGSAATLDLPMGTRLAITVPAGAVMREGDLTGVRVKTATGADLRWVRIGRERGGQVEILSGLSAGDQVIVPQGTAEGK
jgi:hypothetical protein